jgi:hypothetical protein
VNVNESMPAGTFGPAAVHGHGSAIVEVTEVVNPTGIDAPLIAVSAIVTDLPPAPMNRGARFPEAVPFAASPTANEVATSCCAGAAGGGVGVGVTTGAPGELPPPPQAARAVSATTASRRRIIGYGRFPWDWIVKPPVFTRITIVEKLLRESLNVARHTPAFKALTVVVKSGPLPLFGLNDAMGTVPPQESVSLIVPV